MNFVIFATFFIYTTQGLDLGSPVSSIPAVSPVPAEREGVNKQSLSPAFTLSSTTPGSTTATTQTTATTTSHTTSHATTHQHNESTSVPATTRPPTTPTPSPGSSTWFVKDNSTGNICILLKAAINLTFTITDRTTNKTKTETENFVIPDEAVLFDGECGISNSTTQLINLKFYKDWKMTFTFTKKDGSYSASNLFIFYDLKNLPGNKTFPTNESHTVKVKDLSILKVNKDGEYFKCDSPTELYNNHSSTKALVEIHVYSLQLEAFRDSKTPSFNSNGVNCKADSKTPSNLIPIIVGSVLGGLILIVLIAYLISRRKRRSGYESV
jgi:hypothetical protein